MRIEVVEFYPYGDYIKEEENFKGTAHVYLTDFDIDLRGVWVQKSGKRYNMRLPIKEAIDSDTKEKVQYPVFNFANHEKNKNFLQLLKQLLTDYIETGLKENKWKTKTPSLFKNQGSPLTTLGGSKSQRERSTK